MSTPTEIEVDCPGCGLTLVGDEPRASADWFCPKCDYPLFWAERPETRRDESASRAARRRLPGTGGREQVGAGPCWHCGEMNEPGITECLRCAARLPKPLAPTVTVTREVRVPLPVVVHPPTWPFVAAAACGGAAVAAALSRWMLGGG